MDQTKNYNLKKPSPNDFYNIQDFNDNANVIDHVLTGKLDIINKASEIEAKDASSDDKYMTPLKTKAYLDSMRAESYAPVTEKVKFATPLAVVNSIYANAGFLSVKNRGKFEPIPSFLSRMPYFGCYLACSGLAKRSSSVLYTKSSCHMIYKTGSNCYAHNWVEVNESDLVKSIDLYYGSRPQQSLSWTIKEIISVAANYDDEDSKVFVIQCDINNNTHEFRSFSNDGEFRLFSSYNISSNMAIERIQLGHSYFVGGIANTASQISLYAYQTEATANKIITVDANLAVNTARCFYVSKEDIAYIVGSKSVTSNAAAVFEVFEVNLNSGASKPLLTFTEPAYKTDPVFSAIEDLNDPNIIRVIGCTGKINLITINKATRTTALNAQITPSYISSYLPDKQAGIIFHKKLQIAVLMKSGVGVAQTIGYAGNPTATASVSAIELNLSADSYCNPMVRSQYTVVPKTIPGRETVIEVWSSSGGAKAGASGRGIGTPPILTDTQYGNVGGFTVGSFVVFYEPVSNGYYYITVTGMNHLDITNSIQF